MVRSPPSSRAQGNRVARDGSRGNGRGRAGRGRGRGRGGRGGRGGRSSRGDDVMKGLRKEIRDFSRQKRKHRESELEKLGAKKKKGTKTPYKILMGMRKAEKHREEIRARRIKEALGFDAHKYRKKREERYEEEMTMINQMRGNRRGDSYSVGDGSVGFTQQVGRVRNGMLTLSQRDIDRVLDRKPKGNEKRSRSRSESKGYQRKGGYGKKKRKQMKKR